MEKGKEMNRLSVIIRTGMVNVAFPAQETPKVFNRAAEITLRDGRKIFSFAEELKHESDGYQVLGSENKMTPYVDETFHGPLFRDLERFFSTSPEVDSGSPATVMREQFEELASLAKRVAAWRDEYFQN